MVFYRKYRPQTIEELDSKEVRDKLTSILLRKTIHAFLFTGPKGLGKTSAARIVAKVLNCERLKGLEPCNKCSQCISITNGNNLDVLEIDGASNRGIDEIRDLREKVRLSSAGASKKVYIIDEVHMLTTEAFNALLKTLEEPPSHVVFILCTTEPHKVPSTIASRCFHVTFKKATQEELLRSLARIVKREKIAIDKGVLISVSSLSDGSFRDGAKILEELSSGSRKKITKELVEERYQISNISGQVEEMLKLLSEKNTKKSLLLVQKIILSGSDIKYFLEQLILRLHNLLLQKVGVLEKEEKEKLEFSLEEIKKLVELFATANAKLKYAVLPELPLEIAIIEWCEESNRVYTAYENKKSDFLPHTARGARRDLAKDYSASKLVSSDVKRQTSRAAKPFTENDQQEKILSELINKVKSENHSIAGVLRGCSLKSYDGKKLVIEAKFKFHKERLEESKTRELLEKVSEEIIGNKVSILVMLKS